MSAFVPAKCADEFYMMITVGNVYSINKFTVQPYKPETKFLPVRNDYQLVFSNATKIKTLDVNDTEIKENSFDFYDHGDLLSMSKQTTYLADVIGVIKKLPEVSDLIDMEKHRSKQSSLSVMEDEVDLGCTHATKYYINYKHPCVLNIRKMFKIQVQAYNSTGDIEIDGNEEAFPQELRTIINQDYSVILRITEINTANKINIYSATNICKGFQKPETEVEEIMETSEQIGTEATTSTYHLDRMSTQTTRT
uniref:DUF223 domain-containing protein n=1 Tax=Daucus carota subsp. sativus TaxID=79200 RepID=A0A175YMN8_DAUCS